MEKTEYAAPQIVELGDALRLTRGSYPHNPETYGTIDTATPLDADKETLLLD